MLFQLSAGSGDQTQVSTCRAAPEKIRQRDVGKRAVLSAGSIDRCTDIFKDHFQLSRRGEGIVKSEDLIPGLSEAADMQHGKVFSGTVKKPAAMEVKDPRFCRKR